MMKSRDILSPDIGPGIRTQDSVVTSGTTISYATEAVSSLIQPPWRNWYLYRWLPRNPGFESRGRYPEIKYL